VLRPRTGSGCTAPGFSLFTSLSSLQPWRIVGSAAFKKENRKSKRVAFFTLWMSLARCKSEQKSHLVSIETI